VEVSIARYRTLLQAETVRRDVLSGRSRPRIPDPVPSYVSVHLNAARDLQEGHAGKAEELLAEAQSLRDPVRGRVNGESFEDFRDSDDLIAPFLEAVIEGEYCWVPWESIQLLSIPAPKYLRDLFWAPAHLELRTGVAGETYLPVLYSGSHLHPDDLVRLGRTTVWRTDCAGLALGAGQRLFDVGDNDRAILEIHELEFDDANAGNSS
jgi:type VI secretion system protein ImpE